MNDIEHDGGQALVPAAKPKRRAPAPVSMSPMDMLAMAVQRGGGADELAKLWDIAEKVRQQQAHQAFVTAMTRFKQNPPTIRKTREADVRSRREGAASFAYKFANLADVCNAVVSSLSAVGIAHSWSTAQEGDTISVKCTLTHEAGHSQSTMLSAGLDLSGGKTTLQGLGSTVSYLERYTLLAACGLAVDDEQDDDGAGPQNESRGPIPPDERGTESQLLKNARVAAGHGHGEFQRFWKGCTEAQRRELAPHMKSINQLADAAKVSR